MISQLAQNITQLILIGAIDECMSILADMKEEGTHAKYIIK